LATPPHRDRYSCWYHHVFVDRKCNVYVEFTLDDQKEQRYPHLIAVSTDGGLHWQLASAEIFARNVVKQTP
jgi:hypothetical protein